MSQDSTMTLLPRTNLPVDHSASLPAAGGDPAAPRLLRLPQLDLLRGVAILLVLAHHSVVVETTAGRLTPVALFFARFGWTGVDLFFVLSGFLIGGLLFNEIITRQTLDVRRFIIRRGFKIWPAYLALVAFCIVVRAHQQHSIRAGFVTYWPNLLHMQNYHMTPAIHTWSLAVEEHFYLLLPILIVLLRRWFPDAREVRFLPAIAACAFVVCLLLRIQSRWHVPYDFDKQMVPTQLRIDSLFFGVVIAWYYHFHPQMRASFARHRGMLFGIGILLLVPTMVFTREESFFVTTFGTTFAAMGYSMILIAAVLTPPGVGVAGKAMDSWLATLIAYVGLYSYSIYLWHMDLLRGRVKNVTSHLLAHQRPEVRYVVANAIFIVVAVVSGIVMAKLIETPALKLRDRLFPGRVKVVPTAASHRTIHG